MRMLAYRYLPGLAAWVIVFAVLWVAHARGVNTPVNGWERGSLCPAEHFGSGVVALMSRFLLSRAGPSRATWEGRELRPRLGRSSFVSVCRSIFSICRS